MDEIYQVNLTYRGIILKYLEFLNNKTFMNDLDFLFKNPSEFVSSLKVYPFNFDKFFIGLQEQTNIDIPIGGINNSGVKGYSFTAIRSSVKVAEFMIESKYNNFLDYSPYTELELFLPFYGFVTLPTNKVMNRLIKVYYAVDFYTGMCTIYITASRSNEEFIVLSVECKIGIDIPIGSSNYNEVSKNILTTGIGVAGGVIGIATGNVPVAIGGASLLLSTSASAISNLQQHISIGTIGDGVNALATSLNVALIRKSLNPINSDNYVEFKGKPLGETRFLGDLDGYTECDEVHFTPLSTSPTSAEIDEIESLLRSGVIIHA